MDIEQKKIVLRSFTYGLYAVTTHEGGKPHAMLANFMTQVSFEPPLVMVSVERDSRTLQLIRQNGAFAINVLPAGSREVAGGIGRSWKKHPDVDKLEGIAIHTTSSGNPTLDLALGWIECRVVGETQAGDSFLVVAEVIDAKVQREGEALTMKDAGFKHAG